MDSSTCNLDDSMVDIIERAETFLSAYSILNQNMQTTSNSNLFEASSENISFETASNLSNSELFNNQIIENDTNRHNNNQAASRAAGRNQSRSHVELLSNASDDDSSGTVSYEVELSDESHNVAQLEDTEADDCIVVASAPATEVPVIDLCSTFHGEETDIPQNRRGRRRLASTAQVIESIDLDDSIIVSTTHQHSQSTNRTILNNSELTSKRVKESDSLNASISEGLPCSVTCPICFEPIYKKGASSTICGHLYCHSCITRELKLRKKCPMCKQKLTGSQVHRIYFS